VNSLTDHWTLSFLAVVYYLCFYSSGLTLVILIGACLILDLCLRLGVDLLVLFLGICKWDITPKSNPAKWNFLVSMYLMI
jgi:hypothetical protein